MTFAVIPAGGKSTRMGRPKLALPLGEQTVLTRVIAALRGGGIEHILVIAGPHVPELVPLAQTGGAHVHLLAEETPDMRATVERGLDWLEKQFQPQDTDAWLLVPADHPKLEESVVRELVRAEAAHREYSIFIPTYEGRRGHPALIRWSHVAGIRALAGGEGLNVYFRQHGGVTMEVRVPEPSILVDLDTPEDYQRLLKMRQGAE